MVMEDKEFNKNLKKGVKEKQGGSGTWGSV